MVAEVWLCVPVSHTNGTVGLRSAGWRLMSAMLQYLVQVPVEPVTPIPSKSWAEVWAWLRASCLQPCTALSSSSQARGAMPCQELR